ncbi:MULTISPECIES: hypothetical protein [Sorangium]|uniref:Uncharacterized protein n=1 Tax=Sorangium cellulosum TaxID=56 RepID=A0A150PCJ7_SORCE|nr:MULTISPECIES: hypothetical protein [Sorangium]HTN91819.1 hypothetical protein [Sorangium sp.]AUX35854.1 hypothetical protein SOCE836_080550 [Sorangium cellulosum]AUX46249.1 hypothetical protein SOCE26_077540 [Sorangium cellulosum]KYF53376.1 hypothetical protein BE04_09155 [Sorangium cellulosum]KYF78236.1 hypothetical protein BE17_36475 [Sorangium cellulosum]
MWVRRAAIRPVPSYAQVPARVLSEIEDQLAEDDDDSRKQLDDAFTRFEQTQPALADRISSVLSGPLDETALALGYFLTLAIWLAFDELFGQDLEEVTETALTGVEESLNLDEQIRLHDPAEAVDSDDVIAMEQPDVLAFVQEHLDAALEANAHEVDVDDVHAIYRVVLIEVLALSYAVRPPSNWVALTTEFTA